MLKVKFFKHIPSPGAVCPAIVMESFVIFNGETSAMVPETRNTTVLAPLWLTAHRKVPAMFVEDVSRSVVTSSTFPPRPPCVYIPPPSAPGNARCCAMIGEDADNSSAAGKSSVLII